MTPRLALLAALAVVAAPAGAARDPAKAEAQLQKALAGRVAGAERDCISLRPGLDSQVVGNALIYRESSRVWFVNRPANGQCSLLTRDVIPVVQTPSTQLCRGDIIQLYTRTPNVGLGGCGLGRFVPYTRPQSAR